MALLGRGAAAVSHPIPPGTPKAVAAARFGAELRRAIDARHTSIKALERTTGIDDNTIDSYLHGYNLPRTEKAAVLAETLRWPRLLSMIVEARTGACQRPGCVLTFRNDNGRPQLYCSTACQRQAQALRTASTRARQAGQTGDPRRRYQEVAQLRSAVRIGDERIAVLMEAVAAFCAGCEPQGVCHESACALRTASPLPLDEGHDSGHPETVAAARARLQAPAIRAKRSEAMRRVWADPEYHERTAAATREAIARRTPEQREAMVAKAKASYPPERRSEVSKRMHAARRAS